MKIEKEFFKSGIAEAKRNTWGSRYHPTTPTIRKEGAIIKIIDNETVVEINYFDEIVLSIIMKFCFCPIWLIKKFYSDDSNFLMQSQSIDDKINDWIKIGIIWKESAVTGNYVRPTYQLFSLFGESPYQYTSIPFNVLTHTIVEENIMFEVMTGKSQIFENERKNLLPRISELGFDDGNSGTNIIAEEDFRNPKLYTEEGIIELSETEHKINEAIKTKNSIITPELTDFRQFVLVKKINNTGVVKQDYKFHVPDLIIPCLRQNGQPKSIAIEAELSNKRTAYLETMERYKDNNKFGSVYWLCNRSDTLQSLREAYKEAGGTGNTKTYLLEYLIPSPEGDVW